MNTRFAEAVLVVALGGFAIGATDQNATPRDSPAAPTTVRGAGQKGTRLGDTTQPTYNGDFRGASSPVNETLVPGTSFPLSRKDTSSPTTDSTRADPKCQPLSGAALEECLKGAGQRN